MPDLVPLRLLTILEALSGFALLSAALSYILAVYRENGRKTTLASDLALHYASERTVVGRAAAAERDRWLEGVARELVHVTQAHAQYPILHYFRATDRRNSLALQLAPLVRLGAVAGDAQAAADVRFVRGQSIATDGSTLADRYHRLLDYLAYDAHVRGV